MYSSFRLLFILAAAVLSTTTAAFPANDDDDDATLLCPLNFTLLSGLESIPSFPNEGERKWCDIVKEWLLLVLADYVRRTNFFHPPSWTAEACWTEYQHVLAPLVGQFDFRKECNLQTMALETGCNNITTAQEFQQVIPRGVLKKMVLACNSSLNEEKQCFSCATTLDAAVKFLYESGAKSYRTISTYDELTAVYTAAIINPFGPTDQGTAKCLFGLKKESNSHYHSSSKTNIVVLFVFCGLLVMVVVFSVYFFFWNELKFMCI